MWWLRRERTHGSPLVFGSSASSSESLRIRVEVLGGRPPPERCDHKLSASGSSDHNHKQSAELRANRRRCSGSTCSFLLGELGRRWSQLQIAAHLNNRRAVQTGRPADGTERLQDKLQLRAQVNLVGVDGHRDDGGRVEDAPSSGQRLPGVSHLGDHSETSPPTLQI